MRDIGLRADPSLSPADAAVRYLLDRIQYDHDLRWLMLHTEAFHLLCVAEAARTGKAADVVEEFRSLDLRSPHDQREPEVVRLRREVEALPELLAAVREVMSDHGFGPSGLTAALRRLGEAEEKFRIAAAGPFDPTRDSNERG